MTATDHYHPPQSPDLSAASPAASTRLSPEDFRAYLGDRRCLVCSARAAFGFGLSQKTGAIGISTCSEHREAGRSV